MAPPFCIARAVYHFDGEHWAPVDSGASGYISKSESSGNTLMYLDDAGSVR